MGKLFCVVVKINLQARGVQPTHQPAKASPTQPNPTCRLGSVFRGWWVGLGYANFFNSGSS